MPTFLLFGVPAPGCPHMVKLDGCQGWDEGRVRSLLESRGVARRPIAEAEAEEEAADRAAAAAESDCCEGERCRLVKSPQDHV